MYTVTNQSILMSNNPELWTYTARSIADPKTGLPFMEEDLYMHSRFLGYSMGIKSMAFIPCIIGFVVFFILIAVYGRISTAKTKETNKTIEV